MLKKVSFIIVVSLCALLIFSVFSTFNVLANHTDFTSVGGVSMRDDSRLYLALYEGGYVYSPLYVTIGSTYDCEYQILINGTEYDSGAIDVSEAGFLDIPVEFQTDGPVLFVVVIGEDNYSYEINVLMESFEAVFEDGIVEDYEQTHYTLLDIWKAFLSALVGVMVAVFLAYIFKVPKIRQEIMELL